VIYGICDRGYTCDTGYVVEIRERERKKARENVNVCVGLNFTPTTTNLLEPL
jgi:hypothetical protein